MSYTFLPAPNVLQACLDCVESIKESRIKDYEEVIERRMQPYETGIFFKKMVSRTREEVVAAIDEWERRAICEWRYEKQENKALKLAKLAKAAGNGDVAVCASDFDAIASYYKD